MSTVYLAVQLSVGREVALKVLSPELQSDSGFTERFYREANIVGQLSHPNIIAIYDVGKHDGLYYMAMDYLPGSSCKDLLRNRQLSPVRALAIIRDIANAIEYTHDHGFVHCDLKPDNILFRHDGSAVLTDFGIARELGKGSASDTIAGTPHYMSPEQAQGQQLEKSSDIYSMGVMLYEMLSGELPYHGRDALAVAIKHVSAPIPELPTELAVFQALIQRMMAKKPGARLQNGNELKYAIDFFEAQYLRQEATAIPARLKVKLGLQSLLERGKKALGMGRHLHYSFRHGLLLKLVDHDYEIPDIDAISRTVNMLTNTLRTSEHHPADYNATEMALETGQAKVLLPALLINSLLLLLLVSLLGLLTADNILGYLQQQSSPEIIYID